jgi:hypothetical protein
MKQPKIVKAFGFYPYRVTDPEFRFSFSASIGVRTMRQAKTLLGIVRKLY